MNWMITYQDFDYRQPVGCPKTLITETHPVVFRNSGFDEYGNRSRAILFAIEVPYTADDGYHYGPQNNAPTD